MGNARKTKIIMGQNGQGRLLGGGGFSATFKDRMIGRIRWEQGRYPKWITRECAKYYSTCESKDIHRLRFLWRQVSEMQFGLV